MAKGSKVLKRVHIMRFCSDHQREVLAGLQTSLIYKELSPLVQLKRKQLLDLHTD